MMKKILICILSLCLLFSGIAYAATDGLYVYKYNGNTSSENYSIGFNRGNGWNNTTTLHMYYLDKDGLQIPTYCCDFERYIEGGTNYRRLNLEDASYFTADEAEKIRGILNYGYWTDWTTYDLAEAASAAGIENLTAEQALAATQLAIWQYANFADPSTKPEFRTNGEEALNSNVAAFEQYLLNQSAVASSADDVLFTDEVVETHAVFTDNNYTVTAKFKLVSTNVSDLTLTATLGQDIQVFNMSEFKPEDDGFYKIVFTGVTDPGEIVLEVFGTQTVNNVYFYEPIDGRDSSQNLVGWAEDATPVSALSKLEFGFGTKDFAVIKVEKDTEIGLGGATFDLYAEVDSEYVLVKSNLVTDANGKIELQGLADEYSYYLKETSAPMGYILEDNYIALKESTTIIENKEEVPPSPSYTPSTTYRTVQKIWDDAGYENLRPEEVKVQLYKDGEPYGEAVALNADINWSYTWWGLPIGGTYTVQEVGEIDNYICEINDFTITNTYVVPELPPTESMPGDDGSSSSEASSIDGDREVESIIPKTGDDSWKWFLAVLISGLGVGHVIRRYSNERK